MDAARNPVVAALARFAGRLRFPQLFALSAVLLILDLLIPDLIPFADEILLALLTLLLGSWRKQRGLGERGPGAPPPGKGPVIEMPDEPRD